MIVLRYHGVFNILSVFHSLVVRLSADDPIGPVNLLAQYHPHQLMGKGHIGKTDGQIRAFPYLFMQSQGSADHKEYVALPAEPRPFYDLRKCFGGVPPAPDFQCADISSLLQTGQQPLGLSVHDLLPESFRGFVRRLLVRHLHDLQFTVSAQTLGIFLYSLSVKAFLDLSHAQDCNLHRFHYPQSLYPGLSICFRFFRSSYSTHALPHISTTRKNSARSQALILQTPGTRALPPMMLIKVTATGNGRFVPCGNTVIPPGKQYRIYRPQSDPEIPDPDLQTGGSAQP